LSQFLKHFEIVIGEVEVGVPGRDVVTAAFGKLVSIRSVFSGEESGSQRTVGGDGDLLRPAQPEEIVSGFRIGQAEARLGDFETGESVVNGPGFSGGSVT
jgi:hypothetical protein